MAREQHEFTRRSQGQSAVRTFRTQAGRRVRRSRPETGTRKRTSHYLSQQRGGAGHPEPLQQGAAHGSRTAQPPGRIYGQKPLQLTALACVLLLAGCAAHRQTTPNRPAPPPANPAATPAPTPPTPTPTPQASPTPSTRAKHPLENLETSNLEITVPKNA